MPVTVSLGYGAPTASPGVTSGNAGGVADNVFVTITNTGTAAVTLQSLQVMETTESDAVISQPNLLTPNAPLGTGAPVLRPGASVAFQSLVVFNNPYAAGTGPQAPGGANPTNNAVVADPFFTIAAVCQASDGSIASGSMVVAVSPTIGPFPIALGGAWQFNGAANLINGLTLGIY